MTCNLPTTVSATSLVDDTVVDLVVVDIVIAIFVVNIVVADTVVGKLHVILHSVVAATMRSFTASSRRRRICVR